MSAPPQGSAISALMFIIYLDDMMEDYEALNRLAKLPTRQTIQRDPNTGNQELLTEVAKSQENTPQDITQYIKMAQADKK